MDEWDQFEDAQDASAEDPWAQFQDAEASADQIQQPNASPIDSRPVGDLADTVLDPLRVIGSSAIATPIAGLAGLGAAGTRALGLTSAQPADVVESVQSRLTYEPRTKAGAIATEFSPLAKISELLANSGDFAGQKAADLTGSPAAGAAVNTAVQALPSLFLKGRGKPVQSGDVPRPPAVDRLPAVREGAEAPKPTAAAERPPGLGDVSKAVPSLEELGRLSDEAYKRADQAGIVVRGSSLFALKSRVASMAKRESINSKLHPDSYEALTQVLNAKGNLKLSEVENLRKIASDARGSVKPADQRIASKIVDEIDDYLDNLSDADVIAGDATKAKALKEARDLYSRKKKSEEINALIERAKVSAPNFGASGLENALRTEFRALAKNPKRMRRFSKDEQAAIRKVAVGGPIENGFRFLGKFAPTGVVSGVLTGGFGAFVGGPLGASLPLAGLGGRAIATRLTQRNVRSAEELVRRGPRNSLAETPKEKPRNALLEY